MNNNDKSKQSGTSSTPGKKPDGQQYDDQQTVKR